MLSGLLVLILAVSIGYLLPSGSRTDRSKPVAETPRPQVFVEPQIQIGDSPKPKQMSGASDNSVVAEIGETPVHANQAANVQRVASSEKSDLVEESDVTVPLAFLDTPELTATEAQVTEFDTLRQQFVDLMGGPDQDPSSPDYHRRWEDAQRQLDDQFMAFFGLEAFNQQQLQAVRNSRNPTGP